MTRAPSIAAGLLILAVACSPQVSEDVQATETRLDPRLGRSEVSEPSSPPGPAGAAAQSQAPGVRPVGELGEEDLMRHIYRMSPEWLEEASHQIYVATIMDPDGAATALSNPFERETFLSERSAEFLQTARRAPDRYTIAIQAYAGDYDIEAGVFPVVSRSGVRVLEANADQALMTIANVRSRLPVALNLSMPSSATLSFEPFAVRGVEASSERARAFIEDHPVPARSSRAIDLVLEIELGAVRPAENMITPIPVEARVVSGKAYPWRNRDHEIGRLILETQSVE